MAANDDNMATGDQPITGLSSLSVKRKLVLCITEATKCQRSQA